MTTINHETYCGQDLITLLLKAGFDWQEYFVAHRIDEHFHWEIPLHIAQKWLREVKNCSINIDVFVHNLDKNNIYYEYNWIIYFGGDRYSGSNWDDTRYYEVAQKAGVKKALELILEKGGQHDS